MRNLHHIIAQVERYAKQRGLTPGYVSKLALGNFYSLDRLKRRAEKTERDMERLEKYMASNPISTPEGLACAVKHSTSGKAKEDAPGSTGGAQ